MPTTERTPAIAVPVRRVRRTRTPVQGVSPPAGGLGAEPPYHETTLQTQKHHPPPSCQSGASSGTRPRVQGVSPPAGGLGAEPPSHETTRQTQKSNPPPPCQSGASCGRARGCRGCLPLPGVWGQSPHPTKPTANHKSQTRHRCANQARPSDALAGAGGVSPCRGLGGRAPTPQNLPPNTKAPPATVVPIRRVRRTRTRVQGVSPPAGGLGAEPPLHVPHPCFRRASDSKARSAGFTPGIDAARRSVSGRTRRSFSRASKRKPRTAS